MTLSPQFLDQLCERTTLSTLIGRRVKLVKAGREFKGCCPVHSEKTPSFTVNDDKGFYHCFSSGKHGDIISYLQETERLTFTEAVERLASEEDTVLRRELGTQLLADMTRTQLALQHFAPTEAA